MWMWLNILRPKRGFLMHFASTFRGILVWVIISLWLYRAYGPQVLLLPATFSLLFSLGLYRRYRLIVDTPTSKLSSGAQGYVELQGIAALLEGEYMRGLPELPVTLWLPGYIEDEPFVLTDEQGCCVVNPQSIELVVRPADNHWWWLPAIYPGQVLYALGELRTYGGENLTVNYRQRLLEVLADWKRRPFLLLQQFDTNRNGKLDPDEWSVVQDAAARWVEDDIEEHKATRQTHWLDVDKAGQWCMVTNIPPESLAKRYYGFAWLHGLGWLGTLLWLM